MMRISNIAMAFVVIGAVLNMLGLLLREAENKPEHKVLSDQVILLVMDGLRANNPTVGETCIVLAANLLVGDYNTVEHMMPVHGKCATKLIGLYVTKDQL